MCIRHLKYCFKKVREKVKRKKLNKIDPEKIRIQIKFIVDQQVAASTFISLTHQAELSSVRLDSFHAAFTTKPLLLHEFRFVGRHLENNRISCLYSVLLRHNQART